MDSEAAPQTDALSVIHEIESTAQSSDHPEFCALKFRQTLNKSVINMFTDLNKVAEESQNASMLSTFSKFIRCFRHCLEEFPQIFVSCTAIPANPGQIGIAHDALTSNADKEQNNVALAFTEWLIMRLIRVLSQPSVSVIHSGCQDLFISLLQVVRARDPANFCRLANCLLTLLSDLNSFNEKCYEKENGNHNFIIQNYFSSNRSATKKVGENLDLTDIPIVIKSPDECEYLQVKLTVFLGQLITDLSQFLPDQYNNLWEMLCVQIELGELELKKESLNVIASMVRIKGLPTSEMHINYILDCLQVLIAFFCSGQIYDSNESATLELSLALALTDVMRTIKETEITFVLDNFTLSRTLEDILQAIINHGLYKIRSQELQSAILKAILSLISYLKGCGYLLPKEIMTRAQVALHAHFGKLKSHKHLVPLLVFLIKQEIDKKIALKSENPLNIHPVKLNYATYPVEMPVASIDSEPKSKKQKKIPNDSSLNDMIPVYQKMKKNSEIWSSVHEILQNLVKNQDLLYQCDKTLKITNAISACVEILLCSSLTNANSQILQDHVADFSKANCIKHACLPPDLLHSLKCYALKLSTCKEVGKKEVLEEIIILSNSLIHSQDLLFWTTEVHDGLCLILSIPWLGDAKEDDLHDLKCDELSRQSVSHWMNVISSQIKILCLQGLTFLPSSISPYWRTRIIKLGLINEDAEVRSAALQVLPIYFYSMGSVNHILLHELTEQVLQDNNYTVLRTLASIIGKLCCVIDSSCSFYRENDCDGLANLKPKLACNICDKGKAQKENSAELKKLTWLQDIFMHTLCHSNAEVRKESVSNIRSYFAHNEMDEKILNSVLCLITDSDNSIRFSFSNVVSSILKPPGKILTDGWNSEMDENLITKLKSSLLIAQSSGNVRLQETILLTIGQIGKVAKDGLLLIVIISLLESLLSNIPSVLVVARSQLKEIAHSRKLRMADLFKTYREPICKFLARAMLDCCAQDVNRSSNVLEEIRNIFQFNDIRSFLTRILRYILPYLVSKTTPYTSTLLKNLSKQLNIHRRDLLMDNFSFIFSHLVRHCKKSELEKSLTYVQKETELEFGSLLRCNYQHIHNELLLHISTHYEQVFSGLATLAMKNNDLKGKESLLITKPQEMADYLQPKLLGFLVFFDSQLLNNSVTVDNKKLALESLISIMGLMGQRHITAVRFKIMATLRIALRFKEGNFPKISCRAWNTFVHSVDMSSLGPLLNQVVVALLPLLELEPMGVAEIFNFLIVENQSNLKDYFHDLYFIPDIPELQVIHAVLKEYTDKPSSQADFHSVLSHSLKGISHENLEVRLHALAKVKQVLHTHQGAVHEHLLSRESADHLISHLITIILSVCRDTDMRSRILLGECLGELGAIDPGRLELKSTNSTETLAHFYNSIDNENFAYDLIQELVRSFLAAADCRIQDCSAFAIQEVLRIYKCSDEDSSSSSGCQLWKRFPPDIQEILAVLLHSQYKPQGKNKEGFPRPIYRSRMGSTFKDWVTNWFSDLLQKVKQEMATKVFHSCSMIIKHDLNCALFLLPHVVVYALMDGSESEKEQISSEIIAVLTHSEQSQLSSQSDLCYLSSQTVFSVFDHLAKWIRHQQQILNSEIKQSGQRLSEDQAYTSVKHFISQIPQYLLAKSSYGCQAYARALMHLEQHIKNQPAEFQNCISFLQKLYASLDEPDGVAGVAAIRKEDPSLEDQILEHEATGHMQDAFACYEKAVKVYRGEISYYSGLIKCFLWMDQPITALTYANGLLNDRPEWEEQLNSYRIEAAWKLSSWSDLESFLNHVSVTDKWNVSVGKILFAANKEDSSAFLNQMKSVRSSQMGPLSAASMEIGAYLRGYEYLSRLHMLTDLNKSVEVFFNLNTNEQNLPESTLTIDGILSEWKTRQQLVQSSQRYQEPVLDLHRVLLKMGKAKHPELSEKFDHEIAHCWLQSAKLARKNGHQQQAYSCLLEAGTVNSPIAFMEKTKWHWNKGEKEQAINTLNKGIQEHFPDISKLKVNSPNFSNQDQLMCAKAKLLLARYSEESAIVDSNSLIQMYRDVVSIQPQWEESHFHLAKYFDKMLNTVDKPESRAEVTVRIAKSFGNSLQYGCKHVYHSLPRLLDLWFDMGTQVVEHSMAKKVPSSLKQIEMYLNQLSNVIIPGMLEKSPLFHFLTAFPQIISRICHSHSDISEQLQKIIAKLLATYSQQAMWMMIAVSKSSYPTRVQRCKKIFHQAISMKPELGKFIQDTTRLADKLIELSNKSVTDSNILSISHHFQSLPKLIEDRKFSPVLLPFQTQMMVTLPSGTGLSSDHNPFPQTFVYIQGLQDTVEIFPSLQRPKKLTIRGSDGKLYALICKPKDDLRKDCRLIEFNNLVNRYLKRDPESRRRQLYIRTYAVVPLNEECGLIEWVPNLSGLRQILNKIYKDKGIYVSGREIKHMMPPRGATAEQKLQIFKNKFLPRFPPVFSEWFLKTFPDPTAWYVARLAYARTTAVMSMVGYIVGLGDRHGENILFDSSCGDTVHVDLNCLFNKGETLDCPECVPFRLTHNMIDVMGPTGYEGVFRKACEVTMRVMRSQTDALMSVLRPFIHDPLVEWSKSSKAARAQSPASGEIRNEMGLTHVKDIEHRLNGIIKSKNKHQGLPLSIEGQVNYLIQPIRKVSWVSCLTKQSEDTAICDHGGQCYGNRSPV